MNRSGKRKRIILFVMMLLVILPIIPHPANGIEGSEKELPEWTVLVYMAGDNNLEAAAIDDFNEMETVGSTDRVKIVVQLDRASGEDDSNGDWTDTRRYLIQKDNDKTKINSTRLDNGLGELDMTSAATLRDFLLWGIENYPSRHYLVILWDHGLGWKGGICSDQGHYMSIFDMKKALTMVKEEWNHTFDIIGFDACLMGSVEVYYQLSGFANYSFGSEKDEPIDGLPYNEFLDTLVKNPDISVEELLETIVSDYIWSYRGISTISVTYAAVNITRFSSLTDALNEMFNELEKEIPFYLSEIREARAATEEYEKENRYYYVDFLDLVKQIKERVNNPRFLSHANKVEELLNATILYSQSWNRYGDNNDSVRNATGMTIYFPDPTSGSKIPYLSSYINTEFARMTLYDEFLEELLRFNDKDYLAEHSVRATLSISAVPSVMDEEGNINSLMIDYSLSPIKGNSTENLTLAMDAVNSTGVMAMSVTLPQTSHSGNLSFDVREHGFDHYFFHFYLTDANGTLQDYKVFSYDFERYGVSMRSYLKDKEGNELDGGTLTLEPGDNITYYIEVENTGNARRLFRLIFSGVPYKYTITYDSHAFALEPGERLVIPVKIEVSTRSHEGMDTFEIIVRCLENTSVYNSSLLTIRVIEEKPSSGNIPVESIAGITAIGIAALLLIAVPKLRKMPKRSFSSIRTHSWESQTHTEYENENKERRV